MSDRREWVFLNDELVPADAARVSVFDAGYTHAAGIFETFRVYRGRPFRLRPHLDRMFATAAALELVVPFDAGELARAVDDLLAANNLTEARMRITATPGNVPRPGLIKPTGEVEHRPTILITSQPLQPYPPELYRFGMRACISPYRTSRLDPLAGHKTLSYLPRLLSMRDAQQRGCQESLWFNTDNLLAEAAFSNAFVVHEGRLLTPPASTPVLPGITRQAVIDLARGNGIDVAEASIDINMLLAASEVFLTASVLEIMPVTAIEKHTVGEGAPGPMTGKLSKLFADLVATECPA